MVSEDIMSVVYLFAYWIQPLFWMPFYLVKTRRLDFLVYGQLGAATIAAFTAAWFGTGLGPIYLILFYFVMGALLTCTLMRMDWSWPKAVSVSATLIFAASFYWEVPIIVKNALTIGFEWDWIVHIIGIIPVLFIRDFVGWNLTRRNAALLFLGLLFSVYVMSTFPAASTEQWNSYPYLANRGAAIMILFLCMNQNWETIKK